MLEPLVPLYSVLETFRQAQSERKDGTVGMGWGVEPSVSGLVGLPWVLGSSFDNVKRCSNGGRAEQVF